MESQLLIAIIIFLIVIFGMAIWSNKQIDNEEDFLVGGRKFNLFLTTFCLFATWFGAGTLITATDEIALEGLRSTALEPYGAGFCLIFAGLFFAKPLWNMKLMTISDFYRIKFGKKAEFISVLSTIPIYVGWIAVQLIALAQILNTFFGVNVYILVCVIAIISMILTLTGGLWSVSLTDSFQLCIIIIGLFILFFNVMTAYGDNTFFGGFSFLMDKVPDFKKVVIPKENVGEFLGWCSVFVVSAFGNMTGQDLGQRIFAAKSVKVARLGCLLAGLGYLVIGSMPALLGIFSEYIYSGASESVIPKLAKQFLTPTMSIVFILAIMSTVLSTITSAILAPSSVISHNFLKNQYPNINILKLCRVGVFLITFLSVMVAFLGEDIYSILEHSYAIGLVSFFAPMVIGLFGPPRMLSENACLASMLFGMLFWLLEFVIGGEFPFALVATIVSVIVYYIYLVVFEREKFVKIN